MPTGWSLNGTDLRSFGYQIRTVSGWDRFSLRGDVTTIPYRHGAVLYGRRLIQAKTTVLDMLILDRDPSTGTITHTDGAEGHIQDNIDNLLALLYSDSANLDLRRTMPDGSTQRQALCMLDGDASVVPHGQHPLIRQLRVPLLVPSGRWSELPSKQATQTLIGASGSLTATVGGNAPVDDMVLTFDTLTGDVTDLTITFPTGEVLTVAGTITTGDSLVIDLGARSVKLNGTDHDGALTASRGWWGQLEANGSRQIDFACTTSSTFSATLDWNDQWL